MNRLYFGDNLSWLCDTREFPDASVDLGGIRGCDGQVLTHFTWRYGKADWKHASSFPYADSPRSASSQVQPPGSEAVAKELAVVAAADYPSDSRRELANWSGGKS